MLFQKSTIPFQVTKVLSPLVFDYLFKSESLKSFFSFYPDDSGFQKLIDQRKLKPVNRKALVDVLRNQNQELSSATKKNIELLLSENTFTVTTGHQLNLFTGPLYFIYKILTAIKLSQSLKEKFPDKNFVPVYWMASEDHDIEEINHTFVYGKRIEWKGEDALNANGKGAAGRILCKGIGSIIDELKTILGENDLSKKVIDLLNRSYSEENSLSAATRILVSELFGKYGLVILDADNATLKKIFIPVMKDELQSQTSFKKVSETIQELENNKYEVQVHPREINLFYLTDDARNRIVKENGIYKVLNTSLEWNEDALMFELNEHPARFSPNVVLRPLYQETILPNIAYVGGPAEIAYWLQYKSMFDHYNVNFPALVLRNCAMLVDESSAVKMSKLKISPTDIFKSADELSQEFVLRNSDSFSMEEEVQKLTTAFDSLVQKATKLDSTLKTLVEAEKQKQLNALEGLEEKITRAQKKRHETSIQQIRKIKGKFFPDGTLQERQENFLSFYLMFGESFFDELLAQFAPPEKEFLILSEANFR